MGTWKFLDAILLDVHQWSAVFSPNLYCQCSELFPLYWNGRQFCLKRNRCLREVLFRGCGFAVFSSALKPWFVLPMVSLFSPCSVCYKIQTQGGSSEMCCDELYYPMCP